MFHSLHPRIPGNRHTFPPEERGEEGGREGGRGNWKEGEHIREGGREESEKEGERERGVSVVKQRERQGIQTVPFLKR